MTLRVATLLIITMVFLSGCQSDKDELQRRIEEELSGVNGEFAVAFRDISTGEQVLINAQESFHAASTMKTPVMIEVFKQVSEGKFSISDSVTIKNEFKSIVDGSTFVLSAGEDSEKELYEKSGTKRSLYDLVYDMIIASSNLATNMVIELVDARKVTQTMRELGAKDIQVRRGVEDDKAFRQGINNTTTAYDLMLIFSKMAKNEIVSNEASETMIRILEDQKFNEIIPARLPKDVKVAHKTGSITGVQHDSGIVILPDGSRYVLVLLSKDLKDNDAAIRAMANVSLLIYEYVNRN